MTRALILLSVALAIAGMAVADEPATLQVPVGELVEGMHCLADPTQTYTLYLPQGFTADRTWPVLLVFDPRGRSVLAAELFREPAERWGWIVLSSNDTRSDGPMEPNLRALNALWPEIHGRYPVDERRIYAAGFSGGGHVAYLLGKQTGQLAGVIASGSRLLADHLQDTDFALFAAAGDLDFNYREMLAVDRLMAEEGNPHRFAVFDGVHSWMPADVAADAVAWMELVAMRRGLRPVDPEAVQELWRRGLEAARRLEDDTDLVGAQRRYEELVRTFTGLRDVSAARSAVTRLSDAPSLERQQKQERKLLAWEERMKRVFVRAYDQLRQALAPMPAAKLRLELGLAGLQRKADQDDAEGLVARRLLATLYTELSFYLTRELFREGRWTNAASVLEVTTDIVGDRPAPWYNLACAHARSGSEEDALAALRRAVELGYSDAASTAADPDLESLHGNEAFSDILRRMGGDPPAAKSAAATD